MKWIWLVAVIGACAALSSCDNAGPSAQKTVSVPAACPCHPGAAQGKTTVAQTSAPAKLRHRHHHMHRGHGAAQGVEQPAGPAISASNTAPEKSSGSTSAGSRHPHDMAYADRTAPQYRIVVRSPYRHRSERHHWTNWGNRYAGNWNRRYAPREFTQSMLAPYNYVSRSRVTSFENDAGYERRAGYGPHMRGQAFRDTIAATMTGERLDPWHGYDVYCPEQ